MDEVLKRLIKRQEEALASRNAVVEERKAIVEVAKRDLRDDLNDDEETEFRAKSEAIKALDEEIEKINTRIAEMRDEDDRTKRAADAQRRVASAASSLKVNEGRIYERGSERSYFKDLAMGMALNDFEARERLNRHATDVQTAPEYRDLTRVDGSGGHFVPPIWLMDQFAELARAGRATANAVMNQPLPGGTDSINIPVISTGTATAVQTADNAVVQETDLTDSVVTAPVRTVAGQQDVAIQLLEQSPVNFDEIIFRDLLRDYNTRIGLQVIVGSGASGQVTGILTQTGTNAVTYTDATPTVAELYSKLADGVQQITTNRFAEPSVIVMHPRRWAWFLAATDAQGRPLVVPVAQGSQAVNPIGINSAPYAGLEQVVGYVMGLPVITDPSIPTNLGAGTNEDRIIIMRADDLILWESAPRTRVLPDIGSATLTVRLQVYGYVAFTAGRYPKSVSVVAGTGLVAPTF